MLFTIIAWFTLAALASASTNRVVSVCSYNTSLSVPLENITNNLEPIDGNITINLCSGNSILRGDIVFRNKESVNFIGRGDSVLLCQGQSSGITFDNVSYVTLRNIVIQSCGSVHNIVHNESYSSGILIRKSANVFMLNSSVLSSNGMGVVILQSCAVIDIINSSFKHGRPRLCGGGRGLYLDMYYSQQSELYSCNNATRVNIINSHFHNNSAEFHKTCHYMHFGNGAGGGLSYTVVGNTSGNVLAIEDSTFESNKAKWGGGLNVVIGYLSTDTSIWVQNCTFYRNNGYGVGGLNIRYWFSAPSDIPMYSRIVLQNTTFEGNSAIVTGGGTGLYSRMSQSDVIKSNKVIFINCSWTDNRARYASAVNLNLWNQGTYNSREYLPHVIFKDCIFRRNKVLDYEFQKELFNNSVYVHKRGKGCLSSVGYEVFFNSTIQFINNTGSALYLASSTVEMHSGNEVSFIGNRGYYGGAVCLFGSSILHLHDNVTLRFVDNIASVKGGAIYQEYEDTLGYISLRKCFLHYFNPWHSNKTTVSCIFQNNKVKESDASSKHVAALSGHSIYMQSLKSCQTVIDFRPPYRITNNETNHTEYRGPIAHVVFENSTGNEISTPGTKFKIKNNLTHTHLMIPGKVTELPIEVNDDFGRTVFRVFEALLEKDGNNNMSLDQSFLHEYYNTILLYGSPGDKGNITFSLSSIDDEEIILPVVLLECPPGFVIENKNGLVSCVCSLDSRNKNYFGISSCNHSKYQAVLKQGFWLGCNNASSEYCQEYIVSRSCPRNFCDTNGSLILPNTSSVKKLDRLICGLERTGVLCGQCRSGFSAFAHSSDLRCERNSRCKLGLLFYALSEILPVTVFFLVVIVWDVQFTTGSLQGFILYSQLFGTLLIAANGQLPLKPVTNSSLMVLKLFLDLFNSDFFVHDGLSFCLWENASSLDILTFKYVTVVYILSLFLLTIGVLKFCELRAMDRLLKKVRGGKKRNISTSILHGLSGILVICYSQCTKISLLILTPATIFSSESVRVKQVAFYGGELTFLGCRHLLYAIPAMLTLALVIFLPILLLVYPLCYKIFSLLKIEESKFTDLLCRVIPLERMKPFLDSFQSCFKDDCRYFSGLYFIYRLSTLLSFAAFQNLLLYYIIVEIQFVLMLAVHSWVQPYITSWHNKLDTFIFITLIVTNLLTMFRYCHTYDSDIVSIDTVRNIENVQVVIAYLPLLYLVVYVSKKIWLKVRGYCVSCCKGREEELMPALSGLDRNNYQRI